MKKIVLLAFPIAVCVSASFSQTIDSLRIIPSPATSGDSVKVVAILSFPGGPCNYYGSYPPTLSNGTITFSTLYCYESNSGGCTTIDTLTLGKYAPGDYSLSFEVLSYATASPCGSPGLVLRAIGSLDFTVTQGTTGIKDAPAATVKVYPNPVFDFVIFSLTNDKPAQTEIRVLNSSGAAVKDFTLETNPGEQLHGVDLSHLSEGIYFYTIKTKEQLLSGKLVITD